MMLETITENVITGVIVVAIIAITKWCSNAYKKRRYAKRVREMMKIKCIVV